jgi:hypothetical protein
MGTTSKPLSITNLCGGINDADPPLTIADTQVVAATNIDYYEGGLGRKRGGAATVPVTFSGGGGPFGGEILSLVRHIPGSDDTAAELWAFDESGKIGRRASAATWVDITPTDAMASTVGRWVRGASFNGKLFLAYDSAQNRLHCWDGTTLRRVGLATPAAPTGDDSGSGSYAATIRYYKVAYTQVVSGTIVRRSELSPVLTKTPSGSGTGITITKPAAITEGETHWEVYASADNLVFYYLASTAVGTSTYVDSADPTAYSAGAVEPVVNSNLPPPSAKYIITDGNRLIMAGCWETSGGYVSPKSSRVWWTPVTGTLDIGDDERIPLGNYIDLGETDGTYITGLAVWSNAVWVFKTRSLWKLIPTGIVTSPYSAIRVSAHVGAVSHESIVRAVDGTGADALFFISEIGPMRLSTCCPTAIGHTVSKTWRTQLASSVAFFPYVHGVYHESKNQVWWWVPNGGVTPRVLWVLSLPLSSPTGQMAWSKFTGNITAADCSVFAGPVGTTPSTSMVPLIGQNSDHGLLWALDTGTQDITTNYQGTLTTKPYAAGGIQYHFGLAEGQLVARASSGTTITVSTVQDFGVETRRSQVSLSAEGSETSVVRKLEGMDGASCTVVQFTIGDEEASASAWTLDALVVPIHVEESR